MTDNAKPRPTERSEGGSKRTRTRRQAILTEIVMVRISKGDLVALEEIAIENDWSVSQALRVLARRGLAAPREQRREPFEETP